LGWFANPSIGVKLGYTKPDVPGLIAESLTKLNLMQDIKVNLDSLLRAITGDKKRAGDYLNIPMVTDVGDWVKVKVKVDDYLRLVREVCGYLG